ncbi:unnamed protein product [Lupinus luteus]|uniref:NAC domain-containing protein n=1 Tax=Lupinus luteus TaxID=3873 RepID=A0AAV1YDZ4_LUPLU
MEEKKMMMIEGVSREAQMSLAASSMFPGFRFCPTDEELISYYLKKKLDGHEDSVQVISEVELCNFEPWDLPAKSFIQSDNEWFFFSPRGRKYPNGTQSKRATEYGYWKATGKERNVKSGPNVIGTKRTLVFHLGRAPKGERTEWIMHEYCISDKSQESLVICRLKRNTEFRSSDAQNRASSSQMQLVNSHESDGVDQRDGVCQEDKEGSSYGSLSTEQIDSVSESNQRLANETAFTESSGHAKEVNEEDCYAEILKDDIIKLDESAFSKEMIKSEDHTPLQVLHPSQGTAQRRIRLNVRNPRKSHAGTEPCLQSSRHTSMNNTLCATTTNRLLIFAFIIISIFFCLLCGLKQVNY